MPDLKGETLDLSINQQVADKLREVASLLQQQGANPFRVGAYRHAADTLVGLNQSIKEILETQGLKGLKALPGIGQGIAAVIHEILTQGRWTQLERLRGTLDPIHLYQTVPGLGPKLAERIHDALNIDTLEALETAAHDGRLEKVPGVGPRRAASLRASLAKMLGRVQRNGSKGLPTPPLELLLDVDAEYRERALRGQLPRISPRRFNPEGKPWMPILHTQRGDWHFTALYSNTARAHELGRTRDWVVIFFYDDLHREGQQTVVTETKGNLVGKRVIRGREAECLAHYSGEEDADSAQMNLFGNSLYC
ncbi:MAG: helix-hairpin-helix domain-containing protein [Terriglobia bacterium]